MKGFLLDENLPARLQFSPSAPTQHVTALGKSLTDTEVWNHAREQDWVIVTKDADFSERMMIASPPPRVVHLRIGNMRLSEFHAFLTQVWPKVERLLQNHKLINVYRDRLEAIGDEE